MFKINTNEFHGSMINSSLLMDELMGYAATYCSINILNEDGKSVFSKSSSDEWLKIYMDSNLYTKCHLMNEVYSQAKKQKTDFVFLWDRYFPCNEESVYLNRMRQEKNISHGVAFCSSLSSGAKLILTVSGKHHDINFSQNILKNKNLVYKSVIKSIVSK